MNVDMRAIQAEFGDVWAIVPERLQARAESYQRYVGSDMPLMDVKPRPLWVFEPPPADGPEPPEAIEAARPKVPKVSGSIGVLPLTGVITQRGGGGLFDLFFGGTKTEAYGAAFDDMMANDTIGGIVLDIDSPGGTVYGVAELADKIRNARGNGKPIIAVANSLAASAAYWIGSQADQLFVTPGGEVGSIGVFSVHIDDTAAMEAEGIKATVIKAGQYKAEGYFEPLSEEARDAIQADVDRYYEMFAFGVGKGRGLSTLKVRNSFGEGRTVMAEPALKAGMADGIATLEEVLAGMVKPARAGARAEETGFIHARREGAMPDGSTPEEPPEEPQGAPLRVARRLRLLDDD